MLALLLSTLGETPHSTATLIAGVDAVRPGQSVPIVFKIALDPGWHTYWMNPGDSGSPTQIRWKVNGKPVKAKLQYPAPKIIASEGITTYGYEGEVKLVTFLAVPKGLKPGSKWKVEAQANWLVCQEECVMARETLALELPVRTHGPWQPVRQEVARAVDALPRSFLQPISFKVLGGSLGLEGVPGLSLEGCTYLPHQPEIIDHSAPQVFKSGRLLLKKSPYLTKLPSEIHGLLLRPNGAPALTLLCQIKK